VNRAPLHVLIIDDASDNAGVVADALRRWGFRPECVCVDRQDALTEAFDPSFSWDVILFCPCSKHDAEEILELAHANVPTVPLLLISGRGEREFASLLRSGLARAFMSAGHLEDLAAVVRSFFPGARPTWSFAGSRGCAGA
jgi:DNA-binding response OmpR family regulator